MINALEQTPTNAAYATQEFCLHEQCKALLEKGNDAFSKQDYDASQKHYLAAMVAAETLLDETPQEHQQFDNNTALFLVSSVNLAENWVKKDQPKRAVTIMQATLKRLGSLLSKHGEHSDRGIILSRHIRHAISELVHYLRQVGASEHTIARVLTRSHQDTKHYFDYLQTDEVFRSI